MAEAVPPLRSFFRRRLVVVLGLYAAGPVVATLVIIVLGALGLTSPDQGGMGAFGDLLLFIGVLVGWMLIRTLLALWFDRPAPRLWFWIANASLVVAATAPLAGVVAPRAQEGPVLALVGLLALLRLFGTPLLSLLYVLAAGLAPAWPARRRLLFATAIEGGTGACVFVSLLVFQRWPL